MSDLTIKESAPDDTTLGAEVALSQTIYGAQQLTLIKFDREQLPQLSVHNRVTDASLLLTSHYANHNGNPNVSGLTHTVSIHEVTQDWDEDSSWAMLSEGKPGSLYDPTPIATYSIKGDQVGSMHTFDQLGALVEKWARGAENYGLALVSHASQEQPFNFISFRSREWGVSEQHPTLRLEYSVLAPLETYQHYFANSLSPRLATTEEWVEPDADVDNDQLSNLYEYAFGLDLASEDLWSTSSLKLAVKAPADLTLFLECQSLKSDLRYTILRSDNMMDWAQGAIVTSDTRVDSPYLTAQASSSEIPRWQVNQESGQNSQFYKLEVELK